MDEIWRRVREFASQCLANGTPILTYDKGVRNFITDVSSGSIGRRSDDGITNSSRVTRGQVVRLWEELNGGPPTSILYFTRALVAAALPDLVDTVDRRLQLRTPTSAPRAFLLTWNPSRWTWARLAEHLASCLRGEHVVIRWSAGNSKKIEPGHRLFLLKQGTAPRGIMASGVAMSAVIEDEHFDHERAEAGDTSLYVEVMLDRIVAPDSVMTVEHIQGVHWATSASGIELSVEAAAEVSTCWQAFAPQRHDGGPDELIPGRRYWEGAAQVVTVNRYERDPAARAACIARWGTSCSVCDFSFGRVYGEVGEGFINVHHLTPLASGSGAREVNPVEDLRPVCPNCHAMLHRSEPPLAISELKTRVKTG